MKPMTGGSTSKGPGSCVLSEGGRQQRTMVRLLLRYLMSILAMGLLSSMLMVAHVYSVNCLGLTKIRNVTCKAESFRILYGRNALPFMHLKPVAKPERHSGPVLQSIPETELTRIANSTSWHCGISAVINHNTVEEATAVGNSAQ